MRRSTVIRAVVLISAILPSRSFAGSVVIHSAPIYIPAPVYRSAPTFRAPTYYGHSYRSGPSIGGVTPYSHSNSDHGGELANPWLESAPQLRTHPGIEIPHEQAQPRLTAKEAETDLLNKLQVKTSVAHPTETAPSTGKLLEQQKATASQAELQLLNQLHISSPAASQTSIPQIQQKIATTTAAENTLLNSLNLRKRLRRRVRSLL